MTTPPEGLLEVGVVGRPHGLRGETYVDLITDRTERVEAGARLYVSGAWLTVGAAKPHRHRWLVTFDGVVSREGAERLTSARVYAEPIDDPEALWVHDLVGAAVRTVEGDAAGRCVGVVANPASDLLELDGGALVPVQFVTAFDAGVIVIDPPAGLLGDDADVDDAGHPDDPDG